jgi:hypothetical protein
MVEGIRRLERRMDDFAHVETEMQASIYSQTSMTSSITLGFKLEGGARCPGMSPHLSRFIPSFSSYLVTYLARWSYHYRCHDY